MSLREKVFPWSLEAVDGISNWRNRISRGDTAEFVVSAWSMWANQNPICLSAEQLTQRDGHGFGDVPQPWSQPTLSVSTG